MFLHADSEDSDETGWMARLFRVFAGCKGHFIGFVMSSISHADHLISFDTLVNNVTVFNLISTLSFY